MRKILISAMGLCLYVASYGQIETTINVPYTTSASPTYKALLYLPSDYSTTSKSYPLLVFCQSASEAADGASAGTGLAKIYNQASYGGPAYFIEHGGWPASFTNPVNGAQEQFIVVSPQANTWSVSGDQLANIVNYLVATYRVDVNRIHLTGVSAGAAGVVEYAAQMDANEDAPSLTKDVRKWKPADIVAMSEATNDPTQTWGNVVVADSIPDWNFGDPRNDLYGGFAQDLTTVVNKAKSGYARFTSFSTGHGPWNPFYTPTYTENFTWRNIKSNYSVYTWMLGNSRIPIPVVPVANAGTPQTITLPANTATLNGSSSTGNITSYAWTQLSGPAGDTIKTPASISTSVTGLVQGVYVFQLTVTGGSTSTVQVTVNPAPPPPTANAGAPQIITLPSNSVTLSASGSTGTITSYAWTEVSGPVKATISTPTTVSTKVTGLTQAGIYVFQVALNGGSTSTVQVTVNPQPGVANAGTAQTIALPVNSVTLNGSGSTGTITSYAWAQISGPAGDTIITPNAVTSTVTGLVQGTYVFTLTVNGNSTSNVTITVNPQPALVANAGTNQTITLPTSRVTLNASGSKGVITNYSWTQVIGPAGDTIQSPTSASTVVSGMVAGNYTFLLTLMDNLGSTSTSTVDVLVLSTGTYGSPTASIAAPSQTITLPAASVNDTVNFKLTNASLNAIKWTKLKVPGQTQKTVVFLGSSTTAGVGASIPDSGYVPRFTNFYTPMGVIRQVINLSVSGYNPYNAMPTGYVAPASVVNALGSSAAAVDPNNNVTKALSFNPDVVVINYPNNGYDVLSTADIMNGLQMLYNAASANGAQVYVTTTQPREDFTAAIQAQLQVLRDSILLRFGTHAMDFYDPVVVPGTTKRLYPSSADNIHENDQGHRQLFNVVVGTNIFQNKISSASEIGTPGAATTTITGLVQGTHMFQGTVVDSHGQNISAVATITVNQATIPIANAGSPQTIFLPVTQVRLNGNASSGSITSWTWSQVSGPAGDTIANPSADSTMVTGLTPGVYVFQLLLNGGSTSTVQITVNPAPPPVANAGAPQSILLPATSAWLNAKGSGGYITSYAWTQLSGPAGDTIVSPTADITLVTGLVPGTYTFQLTLNGDSTSTVRITVDQPPVVANAGASQTIALPISQVTLDGSGSSGILTQYAWTEVSGPTGDTIRTPSEVSTSVTGLVVGTYVFQLTVTDNLGTAKTDTMTVIVNNGVVTKMINVNVYGGTSPYTNTQWNNWNVNTGVNSSTLTYSDGTSSGVTATLSINESVVDNGTTFGATGTNMAPAAVLRFASYCETTRTLTLNSLKATATYNIELYASRSSNSGQKSVFAISGQKNDTILSYNNLTSKAVFTGLKPVSGKIVITISTPTGYNYLNGFAITELTSSTGSTGGSPDAPVNATAAGLGINSVATSDLSGITLYPNPASDQFTLSLNDGSRGELRITVQDAGGNVLRSFGSRKDGQVSTVNIPLGGLAKGTYFITVQVGNWKDTRKLLKL